MSVHAAGQRRPIQHQRPAQRAQAPVQRPAPERATQPRPPQARPASSYAPPAAKKGPELNGAKRPPAGGRAEVAARAKAAREAQAAKEAAEKAAANARWQQNPPTDGPTAPRDETTIGGGVPKVNYHGTPDSKRLEGSAGSMDISVKAHQPRDGKHFDPTKHNGVALTSKQAAELGVKSGDKVSVYDRDTGKTHEATYYDNAGPGNFDGQRQHFEMTPALAENLGLNVRGKPDPKTGKPGAYKNSIDGAGGMAGRFEIRKYDPPMP